MLIIRNKDQTFKRLIRIKISYWERVGNQIEKYGQVLVCEGFNSQAELLYIGKVDLQMKEVVDTFGHTMPGELEEGNLESRR